jgi:hypothetical protein
MKIELNQKMTLTIGSTDYEITVEDANKLYEQLGVALNKQTNFQLSYPNGVRQWGNNQWVNTNSNVALLAKGNK